jgi:DeoR family transcriptional regulator, ulaG and ulaABCDEF operon transcriptional repressor
MRRDFELLGKSGEVRREWGRLRKINVDTQAKGAPGTMPFAEREILHAEAKARIGAAAAALVGDGEGVLIDGGTTTLQMVPHLARRSVKIVTNSIAIAHAIDRARGAQLGAEVFLTGGRLHPDSFLLVGPQARAAVEHYRARWAFISAAGVDAEVTNSNEAVVEIEQAMIARAERVVLLVDESKFGARGMVRLCELAALHTVVTDVQPGAAMRRKLERAGVRVVVAETKRKA